MCALSHMKLERYPTQNRRDLLPKIEQFLVSKGRREHLLSRAMDNDGIHKFGYRLRELFADLLRLVAPALEMVFDFERAEELPAAYVQPGRGRFPQRFGDMAWRVPRRRDVEGAGPALVVLVEFQSSVNRQMAHRMRDYARLARERLAERGDEPPVLLPIVLYNGSDRWTAPGAVVELPKSWSLACQLALAPFQGWDYILFSLERLLTSGGLARLPLENRAAATLRLQAERTLAGLQARLREEWTRFAGDANAATRRVLHAWAGALLRQMGGAESALPALSELEGLKGEADMATVSEARLGKWFAEVRAEFVAEGVEQGIEQGKAQGVEQERARGLARLRRQAAIKFGARTADRLSALLGAGSAAGRMNRLGDQVSDWMVECERGEDLLSRVAALVGNGGAEIARQP